MLDIKLYNTHKYAYLLSLVPSFSSDRTIQADLMSQTHSMARTKEFRYL